MKRTFALVLLLSFLSPVGATAAVVEGVSFPRSYTASGKTLELNGTGLLIWKWVIKAYVAALYLAPEAQPTQVFEDVPKRLEIEYFYAIAAEDFGMATLERVRLNVSEDELKGLKPRIEQLNQLYRDVEPGDRYAFTYLPGQGTELSLNGEALGTIPGVDLARALFAIWLGDVPLDDSLKQALLGSPS